LSRADSGDIDNLGGWLTTAVAREALDMLRARVARREQSLDAHVPDPIVGRVGTEHPEDAAVMADSIGLALLVVLEALAPAERVAFVLHDIFAVPFDDIAPIVERSPAATRQLASRARRRVRAVPTASDRDPNRQRRVVDAFFAAARNGDFDALVELLDPEVVHRADGGIDASRLIRGAANVANSALMFADPQRRLDAVLVNGSAGVVVTGPEGDVLAVMGFTVRDGVIASIDSLTDRRRLEQLDLSAIKG
jgi:RNA polymerase sigma-70 factor (ECF subfamily)